MHVAFQGTRCNTKCRGWPPYERYKPLGRFAPSRPLGVGTPDGAPTPRGCASLRSAQIAAVVLAPRASAGYRRTLPGLVLQAASARRLGLTPSPSVRGEVSPRAPLLRVACAHGIALPPSATSLGAFAPPQRYGSAPGRVRRLLPRCACASRAPRSTLAPTGPSGTGSRWGLASYISDIMRQFALVAIAPRPRAPEYGRALSHNMPLCMDAEHHGFGPYHAPRHSGPCVATRLARASSPFGGSPRQRLRVLTAV